MVRVRGTHGPRAIAWREVMNRGDKPFGLLYEAEAHNVCDQRTPRPIVRRDEPS